MNKKNKNKKEPSKFNVKTILTSKRVYIALATLIIVFGTTALVRKLTPSISSFDEDAFENALSQVETTKNDTELGEILLPEDETIIPVEEDFPPVTVPVSKELSDEEIIQKLEMIMPCNGKIIKEYSPLDLIYYEGMNDWRTHSGIDIASENGSIVCASADGVVEEVYEDNKLGIVVIVGHENNVKTLYANLADKKFIEVGRKVTKGDAIGSVGNSSVLEGDEKSHLHFEVTRNGETQNPSQYISL